MRSRSMKRPCRKARFFRGTMDAMRLPFPVILLLIASLVLAVSHGMAIELFLYWQHKWLDIPMHVLGGIVVALALFSAVLLRLPVPKKFLRLPYVLAFVFIVGVIWELFELATNLEQGISVDTIVDLCMDMLGGFIGYFVASRTSDI